MKVKVHDCNGTVHVIQCTSFQYRESGVVTLLERDRVIALFGPGFRGFLEFEHEHYDRGS